MLLKGRAAVITGAGRGIGRATALLMTQEGAKVVVNDYGVSMDGRGTSSEPANQVVAEIKAAGGEAVATADSVATAAGARNIIACGLENFGRIDILVNGAGNLVRKFMIDTDEDDWDRQFDVHLKGQREKLRDRPVRLYVMGADEWRGCETWPPPALRSRYYLHKEKRLSVEPPVNGEPPDQAPVQIVGAR